MAKYNEILVGRFNRFLQKFTQIKGTAPSSQLGGEIVPIIPFFNGPENRYIESWSRFASGINCPAVAAQSSQVMLRNPANSNILAVLEKWLVVESLADPLLSWNNNYTADLATTFRGHGVDLRQAVRTANGESGLIVSRQNAANVNGQQIGLLNMQPNVAQELVLFEDQEIPILPGDGLSTFASVVNVSMLVYMVWRERFLEESERT